MKKLPIIVFTGVGSRASWLPANREPTVKRALSRTHALLAPRRFYERNWN